MILQTIFKTPIFSTLTSIFSTPTATILVMVAQKRNTIQSISPRVWIINYNLLWHFSNKWILGDNYGNSVQYQALGRIDDASDEWIDDDLLRKVFIWAILVYPWRNFGLRILSSRALLITFWAPVPWVAELMDHVIEPLTFWMSKMIMKIFSMMLWTWVYYCEGFLWKGVMIRCWWLDVGDRISILVTYFECWCPTPTRKEIGCWWQKWPKLFRTS